MAIINPGCVTEGDAGTNHATSKDKDKEGLAELAEKSNAVRRFKKGKASDLRSGSGALVLGRRRGIRRHPRRRRHGVPCVGTRRGGGGDDGNGEEPRAVRWQ